MRDVCSLIWLALLEIRQLIREMSLANCVSENLIRVDDVMESPKLAE
jgi:hypothetical protein